MRTVFKVVRRYTLFDELTYWSSGFTLGGIQKVFEGGHPKEHWLIQYEIGQVSKPNKADEPLFSWDMLSQAAHGMYTEWPASLDIFRCEAEVCNALPDWYADVSWHVGIVFCDWIKPIENLTKGRIIREMEGWLADGVMFDDNKHRGSEKSLKAAREFLSIV